MVEEGAFGSWLKRRRKVLDLTQEELARQIGCSTVMVVKLETGERRPSKQVAERLAEHLGVGVEERPDFVRFARGGRSVEEPDVRVSAGQSTFETAAGRRMPGPSNIPIAPTRLIGREHDVAQARSYLLGDDVRLLTLLGPAGVGKTRLSLAVAAELRPDFPDGVWFVALAAIRDEDLVLTAIAETLDLKERRGEPRAARLRTALSDKRLLMVLDNFEQVAAAGPLVADLLAACPHLKVLVTSRMPLHVRVEQLWPLAPLALPDRDRPLDLDVLGNAAAVALFVERSRAVKPDFILTEDNASDVADICRRLDGLPLAIELIAARSRLLVPHVLLEQMASSSLQLLTNGPIDMPRRHQTLRAAIDWSYALLSQPAQRVFRHLGVFVEGWSAAAAEAVCGEDRSGGSRIMDDLQELLDSSLIHEADRSMAQVHGSSHVARRFIMLETIREYALELLEEHGEDTTLRRQHAAYYLTLAEAAQPDLRRRQQSSRFAELQREHANLRTAFDWLQQQGESEAALRLAGALWWFWYLRSYWSEGRARLISALSASGVAESAHMHHLRMNAFTGLGAMAWIQGDLVAARTFCEESVALAEASEDQRGLAYGLNFLGLTVLRQGDDIAARSLLTESVVLFRTVDDRWGLAHALICLRQAVLVTCDYASALKLLEESVALWRELEDTWGLALSLNGLGELARCQGEFGEAARYYSESLALFRAAGDNGNTAIVLHNLAQAVLAQGAFEEAAASFAEALLLDQQIGNREAATYSLAGLAAVAVAQRQKVGKTRWATQLLGAVQAQINRAGVALCPADRIVYDRNVAIVRAELDEADFMLSWAAGNAMSLEQATSYALIPASRRPK